MTLKLKKYDIVLIECYNKKALGFVDFIDEETIIVKTGYGRGTDFVAWFKDRPLLRKINIEDLK